MSYYSITYMSGGTADFVELYSSTDSVSSSRLGLLNSTRNSEYSQLEPQSVNANFDEPYGYGVFKTTIKAGSFTHLGFSKGARRAHNTLWYRTLSDGRYASNTLDSVKYDEIARLSEKICTALNIKNVIVKEKYPGIFEFKNK